MPKGLDSIPPDVRIILRLSLYQLLFLENIPQRAALDQAVRLTKWAGFEGLAPLVNGVLRSILKEGLRVAFPDRESSPDAFLATYYSHPLWLVRRWLERFGYEETEQLLEANNASPDLMVRMNTLRTTIHSLKKIFEEEGVEYTSSAYCEESLKLRLKGDIKQLSSFREGLYTVQDISSTLVGQIPDVDKDTRSLDLCAAPGGKCTHLAERGEDSGLVLAVDSSRQRMKLVLENIERLRFNSILCTVADGRSFSARQFDLVVVDAPCTGTGVLSRRADLRWRLKEEDLYSLNRLQSALLLNASTLVKSGGNLLYSTCSLEPEENIDVIENFLAARGGYTRKAIVNVSPEFVGVSGCLETLPHRHRMDGMFACIMARK